MNNSENSDLEIFDELMEVLKDFFVTRNVPPSDAVDFLMAISCSLLLQLDCTDEYIEDIFHFFRKTMELEKKKCKKKL